MKVLNPIDSKLISGGSLNFGNGLIIDVYVPCMPYVAKCFFENNLQQVIDGNLAPDVFITIIESSRYAHFLEEFMEELDMMFPLD